MKDRDRDGDCTPWEEYEKGKEETERNRELAEHLLEADPILAKIGDPEHVLRAVKDVHGAMLDCGENPGDEHWSQDQEWRSRLYARVRAAWCRHGRESGDLFPYNERFVIDTFAAVAAGVM